MSEVHAKTFEQIFFYSINFKYIFKVIYLKDFPVWMINFSFC